MRKPEASLDLWEVFRNGDPETSREAYEEIAMHYQYIVEGNARKIERRLPSFVRDEELVSHGQVGLLKAIAKYTPEVGPFSRYASQVIYGAVIDGLRHDDFAPRGLRRQQRDLDAAVQAIRDRGGDDPTNEQIAAEMDIPVADVLSLQKRIMRADVTPQAPTLLGAGKDTSNLASRELCREFVVWLKEMDEDTQKIIAMRYWSGDSVKAISVALGLTSEQVREKHNKVLSGVMPLMLSLVHDD